MYLLWYWCSVRLADTVAPKRKVKRLSSKRSLFFKEKWHSCHCVIFRYIYILLRCILGGKKRADISKLPTARNVNVKRPFARQLVILSISNSCQAPFRFHECINHHPSIGCYGYYGAPSVWQWMPSVVLWIQTMIIIQQRAVHLDPVSP